MERTKEVLDNLDNYLRLMRFKYTDLEKLSRLKILEDYYSTTNDDSSAEKLNATIESAEQLSNEKLILPLKVRGVFLTEGRPLAKFYSAEELEKSTTNPINQTFPLMLDHKDNEAGSVIGTVDKIEYSSDIKGIKYWAHVNSETHARNILDGAIKEVSATIYSGTSFNVKHGITGVDLTYKELSLVMKGAVKDNYLEVDN